MKICFLNKLRSPPALFGACKSLKRPENHFENGRQHYPSKKSADVCPGLLEPNVNKVRTFEKLAIKNTLLYFKVSQVDPSNVAIPVYIVGTSVCAENPNRPVYIAHIDQNGSLLSTKGRVALQAAPQTEQEVLTTGVASHGYVHLFLDPLVSKQQSFKIELRLRLRQCLKLCKQQSFKTELRHRLRQCLKLKIKNCLITILKAALTNPYSHQRYPIQFSIQRSKLSPDFQQEHTLKPQLISSLLIPFSIQRSELIPDFQQERIPKPQLSYLRTERLMNRLRLAYLHITKRHTTVLTFSRLMKSCDVESNPGLVYVQTAQVKVITYNVRGLGDERKLRHLLNRLATENTGKNLDLIVCLQETYIESEGKIPYIWRGNYHLTPGLGRSCGSLTLLSAHITVVEKTDIENRAHVLYCEKSNGKRMIIVNLYAPNANNNEKAEFFETVFETASEYSERYNCDNILITGDFNLVFNEKEVKNRIRTSQEKRIADLVKDLRERAEMKDIWEVNTEFTWRRANTDCFSTIDRVLYTPKSFEILSAKATWSFEMSDHAAVVVEAVWQNETIKNRTH